MKSLFSFHLEDKNIYTKLGFWGGIRIKKVIQNNVD